MEIHSQSRPNILLILNDDMGYSDLGCYGSEIQTPNLDRLASRGLRFTQFYNTARCCPSRASLLTGLHPHQADVGDMVGDDQIDGYLGDLSMNSATIAEVMKENGYKTLMSGKWHVTGHHHEPKGNWPTQRGFDEYYGNLGGCSDYYRPSLLKRGVAPIEHTEPGFYYTDAITDEAVDQLKRHFGTAPEQPFFQYVAYTAPHWPMHALPEDIAKYDGRYDAGWDQLREERLQRMRELGLLDEGLALSPRDLTQPAWEDEPNKAWQAKRMEVYAAMIDRMDQGIGRIIENLESAGQLENTLIIFLADNGGCAEEMSENWGRQIVKRGQGANEFTRDGRKVRFGNVPGINPGPEDTYQSYGIAWANASNTPFRKYKSWVHEGGISTPFIAHWPEGIAAQGELRKQPAQLPDVMATIIDVAGAKYPQRIGEREIIPHEGYSLCEAFENRPHGREVLTWEHEGNAGVRKGRWKMVRSYLSPWQLTQYPDEGTEPGTQEWELYDIEADRSELHNLAGAHPEIVAELERLYREWAERCGVRPREEILEIRKSLKGE